MEKDQSLDSFTGNSKEKAKPIAIELAKKQREISIAEFFEKNRHLLGFDNKRKALLTTVKEAVDNSLDACEEAKILPEIVVEIIDMGNNRYRVCVEDNGPGIVKEQIPNIFAKLLYGSKFHRLKQSRGQQGIGISASVMYGQLTTGRAAKIVSKIGANYPAHEIELKLDTAKNKPLIVSDNEVEWHREHGTRVEIDLEGDYLKGSQSVDEYLMQTAIINPHVTITYQPPNGAQMMFVRITEEMPKEPKEIKPHPYGVELGMLMKMLENSEHKTLQGFFTNEFSRVSASVAKEICEHAFLLPNLDPKKVTRENAEKIMEAIKNTKIMSPPTDTISPIGKDLLERGLKKEINAEFYASISRQPEVYRGNPFIVEAAVAYGGNLPEDKPIDILRFANRVPLLYQQGACAVTKAISSTNWRSYGLKQSSGSIPIGGCIIQVHIASVWVPFTSEAKEAIAHYPEIIKEIKLALQDVGRELGKYLGKKKRLSHELKKVDYISKYLGHVSSALKEILTLDDNEKARLEEHLKKILEQSRSIDKEEIDELKKDYGPKLKRDNTDIEDEFDEPDEESSEDSDESEGGDE